MRGYARPPAWPPPAFLRRRASWFVLLALLLVPFLVPIPRALQRDLVIATLGDRAHVVLMAGLVLALYWAGPLRGRLGAVVAVTAVLGGAIEFLQLAVGRSALWHDFLLDLLGVALAAGLVLWRGHGRRGGLALAVAALAVTVWEIRDLPARRLAVEDLRASFPRLTDFDGPRPAALWSSNGGGRLELARDGDTAALHLTGAPPDRWPGATLRWFPHDWSAYDTLRVEARLVRAAADTVRVGIRLDDRAGRRDDDWLSAGYDLTAAPTRLALPFQGAVTRWSERPFQADDVFALAVFLFEPVDTVTIAIRDARLE